MTNKEAATKKEHATADECVFCADFAKDQDDKSYILKRFKHFVVMLARYPYNPGHLMILPTAHINHLSALSAQARAELIELINHSCLAVQKVLKAEGINSGVNIGKASGAGIPSHLHWHVVPRWSGDNNFMTSVANTKVFSINLDQIYHDLKPEFDNLLQNID